MARSVKAALYRGKPTGYFDGSQHGILDVIPAGPHTILDVGCGTGVIGALLTRRGHAATVIGVELEEDVAAQARTRLDRVIVGDIQTVDVPYSRGYFDYIWCGDVIEHLVNPGRRLRRVGGDHD